MYQVICDVYMSINRSADSTEKWMLCSMCLAIIIFDARDKTTITPYKINCFPTEKSRTTLALNNLKLWLYIEALLSTFVLLHQSFFRKKIWFHGWKKYLFAIFVFHSKHHINSINLCIFRFLSTNQFTSQIQAKYFIVIDITR